MYLCAGDKAIGAKNFQSARGSKPFRRELATKALRRGISPRNGLEAVVFDYKPPEKPLAVGLLGAGQQGRRLLRAVDRRIHRREVDRRHPPVQPQLAAETVKDAPHLPSPMRSCLRPPRTMGWRR